MSLRDEILASVDLQHEDVVVPEWGDRVVRLSELTALDRIAWDEETVAAGENEPRLRQMARFVVRALRDPASGDRLFTSADVDALVQRSARVLVRLFEAAVKLNVVEEAPGGLSPKA